MPTLYKHSIKEIKPYVPTPKRNKKRFDLDKKYGPRINFAFSRWLKDNPPSSREWTTKIPGVEQENYWKISYDIRIESVHADRGDLVIYDHRIYSYTPGYAVSNFYLDLVGDIYE